MLGRFKLEKIRIKISEKEKGAANAAPIIL
jgi:hypothetical protein